MITIKVINISIISKSPHVSWSLCVCVWQKHETYSINKILSEYHNVNHRQYFIQHLQALFLLHHWKFIPIEQLPISLSSQPLAITILFVSMFCLLCVCVCVCVRVCACVHVCTHIHAQSCSTLCNPMNCSLPGSCPWSFPGKNTGAGHHFLFQVICLTQELSPYLLRFLHCQLDSYHCPTYMTLTTLDTSQKQNHIASVLWRLTYFTQHNIFQVSPCCLKWQDFLLC